MGKLRIRRKSYVRKPYRRKSGIRVKGSRVKSARFTIKDRGAPGRTPRAKRWYSPKGTLRGWSEDMSEGERRKRAAIGRSDLSSARALQSLANVTTDKGTERKARADARYFFARHKSRRK